MSVYEVQKELQNAFDNAGWSKPIRDILASEEVSLVASELPKVDLHRHLEGAIEPEDLIQVAKEHGIALPSLDIEELRPHIQITPEDRTLGDFLKKFSLIGRIFTHPEVVHDLTYKVIERAHREGLAYLELRFSPTYMAAHHNIDLDDLMGAVLTATDSASRDCNIPVNLILIIERQNGVDEAWKVTDLLERYRDNQEIVALDLANDEFNFPPDPYEPVYQRAKELGVKKLVHASEAAGPENTRTAIERLYADRIGHGTRIREDQEVVELVKRLRIPLEMCLTSNVQTSTVADIEDHPIRDYLEQGLVVTINSDDPGISGITMVDEFELAIRHHSFSFDELFTLTRNAVQVGFLPLEDRQRVWDAVESGFRRTAERYLLKKSF